MKRHHSQAGLVRGKTVARVRKLELPSGVIFHGKRPCILVTVKTGSSAHWRKFLWHCKKYGLEYQLAGTNGRLACEVDGRPRGHTATYEVSGWGGLEELTELPCVVRWEWMLNVGAPRIGGGMVREPGLYRRYKGRSY